MTIQTLAAELAAIKAQENALKAQRTSLEEQIANLVPVDTGKQKTITEGLYKLTVKRPINLKLDAKAWEQVKVGIPANMRPVKTKLEVDQTGLNWLQENKPELYAIAAQAITTTEGKPSVTATYIGE